MPDLTSAYQIPRYAQDSLFLVCASQTANAKGVHGEYSLDKTTLPVEHVELHWAHPDGPALACWDNLEDWSELNWTGQIKVGGFIERLHGREISDLEVVIAEVVGGPLPGDHISLPTLRDMRNGVFAYPADREPLKQDQIYPFIILAESNFATLAQDALVSGLAVDAYGSLTAESDQWHKIIGLPLQLESLTLLAP